MAKRKTNKVNGLGVLLALILVALAIVAVIMPLGAGIHYDGNVLGIKGSGDYKGFDFVFGAKDSNGNVTTDMVPGLLSAWILVLGGALCGLLAILNGLYGSQKSLSKVILAFGGLIAFVGGILFFCAIPLAGFSSSSSSVGGVTYTLGAGFIFSGICGVAGGLAGMGALVVK
jgi:hypothetical protein